MAEKTEDAAPLEPEAPAPAPKKKKKKKKKKISGPAPVPHVPLSVRLKTAISGAKIGIKDLFASLRHEDPGTRKMAILFFLSCLGLIATVSGAILYVRAQKAAQEFARLKLEDEERKIRAFYEQEKSGSLPGSVRIELGRFTFDLIEAPGTGIKQGVVNMAEVLIIVEVDSEATQKFIKANMAPLRNVVQGALIHINREELMSADGKTQLKNSIKNTLNDWLKNGSVNNVYFTKLIIG